ncbi:hypothetical protein EC968_003125 [Mortierella alpina]|nr:hypothetical protein EC968_003125 [Mortierella alpina]
MSPQDPTKQDIAGGNNWQDKAKLDTPSVYLDGSAQIWYEDHHHLRHDYGMFKEAFLTKFMTPMQKAQAHQRLLSPTDNMTTRIFLTRALDNKISLVVLRGKPLDYEETSIRDSSDPLRGKIDDPSKRMTAIHLNLAETQEAVTKIAFKIEENDQSHDSGNNYGPRGTPRSGVHVRETKQLASARAWHEVVLAMRETFRLHEITGNIFERVFAFRSLLQEDSESFARRFENLLLASGLVQHHSEATIPHASLISVLFRAVPGNTQNLIISKFSRLMA